MDTRSITSPENGRQSRPEGQDRSSHNERRYRLLARCTVLTGENDECFVETAVAFDARFQPQDEVEEGLVEEMVSSTWRVQRIGDMQTLMLNRAIKEQSVNDNNARLLAAHVRVFDTPEFKQLLRYETAIHRKFQRSLQMLKQLRQFPLAAPAQQAAPTQELQTADPPVEPTAEHLPAPPPQPMQPAAQHPRPPIAQPNTPESHSWPAAEDPGGGRKAA